jgi:hypothetical protein
VVVVGVGGSRSRSLSLSCCLSWERRGVIGRLGRDLPSLLRLSDEEGGRGMGLARGARLSVVHANTRLVWCTGVIDVTLST